VRHRDTNFLKLNSSSSGIRWVPRFLSGRAKCRRSDRHGTEHPHECADVLLQNLLVEVLGRIAGAVIAGNEWPTRRTTEQLGLRLRLRGACTSVETHGRHALLGERGVVGSETTSGARRARENQRGIRVAPRPPARRSLRRNLERSARSWRTDHVKIDVDRYIPALILGQSADMVTRTDEAALRCGPGRPRQLARRRSASLHEKSLMTTSRCMLGALTAPRTGPWRPAIVFGGVSLRER
jgi:hypothetical protein